MYADGNFTFNGESEDMESQTKCEPCEDSNSCEGALSPLQTPDQSEVVTCFSPLSQTLCLPKQIVTLPGMDQNGTTVSTPGTSSNFT